MRVESHANHRHEEKIKHLEKSNQFLQDEVRVLREQVKYLRQALFGPKSDKVDPSADVGQGSLFEIESDELAPEPLVESQENDQPTPQPKAKRGRRKLPENLERVHQTIDLNPEEKVCDCGHERACIGADLSETLERVPARFFVQEVARLKYACQNPDCCLLMEGLPGVVVTAPVPERMVPKSMIGSSLLAYIMTAKFVDGLPFYRVESQLARDGFHLSRQTMSRLAQMVGEKMEKLWDMLREVIFQGKYLQIDETTVQVMREDGRKNTSKSYTWVIRGGPPETPITLFYYDPSRSSEVAERLLKGFRGVVQTDGYEGYSFLDSKDSPCIHAGCLAHARRKFVDVVKCAGKNHKPGYADEIIELIRRLYKVEKEATKDGLSEDQRLERRQQFSGPLMKNIEEILRSLVDRVPPPKQQLGIAINYTLNQWPKLQVFLKHGYVKLDTNDVENNIRPFVIGRKAWLFSGSPEGAKANAILYSMITTAKAAGWEPFQYLHHVFEHLPKATSEQEFRALLPIIKPLSAT
jgi:transposase